MDEKILQDEMMSADELDAVAGGDCYKLPLTVAF